MPKKNTAADLATGAEKELRKALRAAHSIPALRKRGPTEPWDVHLELVGEKRMTDLNLRYRKKGYPTDVLSFPALDIFRQTGYLGELVICLPTARRQAREQGHSEVAELRVLMVHGLLHLLGLDHELGAKHAAEMARYEKKLLARPGLIRRGE